MAGANTLTWGLGVRWGRSRRSGGAGARVLRGEAGTFPGVAAAVAAVREGLVAGEEPVPLDGDGRRLAVALFAEQWLSGRGVTAEQRDGLLRTIVDDLCGAGPLEQLLADPRVTEIMVNGPDDVWIEVDGRLSRAEVRFEDDAHVLAVLERLLAGSGRRIDEGSPTVDARLPGGARLNAVLPPVATAHPLLTIRRPSPVVRSLDDLVVAHAVDRPMAAFLHAAVLGRLNLLVTGATGAGKTTLLAALCGLVPDDERIVTIEDTAELVLRHPHAACLEGRPAGAEGCIEVGLRELVRNSLRMRPDRIAVGEVRGPEAAEMIQAMNTGHAGSMATLHANSAEDALQRLAAMLAMAWPSLQDSVLERWIGIAVDVVVHCERTPEGRRRVASVSALDRGEGGGLDLTPLFVRDAVGTASATGEVPARCLERMAHRGVRLPATLFAAA